MISESRRAVSGSRRTDGRRGRVAFVALAAVLYLAGGVAPAAATEVPTDDHDIDASFDGAQSVFAADVDGDGNTDIIGAALDADDITWWRNPGGVATTDGTTWAEHTIDGSFDGARSVHAADVDGDGNIDILGAASIDDDIAWWRNPGGAATTDGTVWAEHIIASSLDARAVYAADVDGDGNTDILGTALSDDDIRWWENPGGAATTDGTVWAEHIIDASFNGPESVYAADVDGDGNIDILGAASDANDITWWENPGGAATTDGTVWAEHTVDGAFGDASQVYAADVDGDGNTDILGAADNDDDITWWQNRGGQFGLPTTSIAPAELGLPSQSAVLRIDAVHNGRSVDTDVELVTFELLFDDGTTALTTSQANDLIENLYIYLDNGSGVFDPTDTLVLTVSTFSLTAGVQEVSFADGSGDAQVPFGTAPTYFAVIDAVAGGLLNMVRVTHLTESSSSGEDTDHDIPLKLEYSSNVSTPTIAIITADTCPADLVLANQTLSGTQTLEATTSATLGTNLSINGTNIAVNAPVVSILAGTEINGTFSVGSTTSCP